MRCQPLCIKKASRFVDGTDEYERKRKMVFVPIIVKSQEELEKASKLKRTIIVVKNQELFEAIRKQKKKLKFKKMGSSAGVLGGVALGVFALVCPVSILAYVSTASFAGVGLGAWGKLTMLFEKGLKNYSFFLDEEKKVLILINQKKISGKKQEVLIDGYNNGNESPVEIEPVYIDSMEQLKFYINQKEKCIISRREFYIEYKTNSKNPPLRMKYKTYESKEDKVFVLCNKETCDLNICKIKGVDINSIILNTEDFLL